MRPLPFLSLAFIILCFSAPPGMALTTDQEFIRALMRSRSPNDIRRVTAEFDELKIARSACRIQLRRQLAPIACYESLALEIRRGLHPRVSARRNLTARLDELCETSAASLKVPQSYAGSTAISVRCRKNLNDAKKIQTYRQSRPDFGPEID